MNKARDITSTLLLFILFMVPFFAGDAFGKEKAKGEKFDFAKTTEFIKEMEKRPDFPVSIGLAYDYIYSLRALGEIIQPARKTAVIAYLKKAEQKDGGFIGDKANKTTSSLFTDIALDTLAYLESPGALDTEAAKKFILSLKNPDGGFGFSAASRESTIATTYYAVKILASLNALSSVDKAKTAEFVKRFEKKDTGGFGYVEGKGIATAKSTYMAAYTLISMGMLDEATRKNSLRFLEATPCGKKSLKKEMPELNEVSYALRAAKLLKAEDSMDHARIMTFLHRLYIPVNGGFGAIEGYNSSLDATTTALRILVETGRLRHRPPGRW